jgi:hypothetical protein
VGRPSPTISPISNANEWMRFTLNGVDSPGTIARDGVKGFKRETGWDIKKGKGTQGATLTRKSIPPVEGTFTLQLFTDPDFAAWDNFVARVLSIDPKVQEEQGLLLYYPGFSSIGLTSVVVKHYTPPRHMGKGMYHVEVELLEWQQPPPQSVVQTVNGTAPDKSTAGSPPPPPDPRITALQAQIALLNQAHRAASTP